MIQVGIFTGVFPYSLEEIAKRIRALGFNTVQLDLNFKEMDLSKERITPNICSRIRNAFRSYNLSISVISGYANVVSS